MRHHHETSTNKGYGITSWPIRHHHTTNVELRLDQWGTTRRSHLEFPWNYALTNQAPPRNNRWITSWPHQYHVPSINIKSLLILIPCLFHNQPSHTCHMPRSCKTYQLQPINHFTHAYSLISCFNIAIQPIMWQTPKNREENISWAHSRPVLTQAKRPRSSELLSPRRELEKWEQWPSRSLTYARHPRLTDMDSRSKQELTAWAIARASSSEKLLYSHLGETSSPGWKYQNSPLFTRATASHLNQMIY